MSLKHIKSIFLVVLTVMSVSVLAGTQDVILIKNGTVVPVAGESISEGNVLIKDGKIAKIGPNITAPPEAEVIDASGNYVYPGMVHPLTTVGLTAYPGQRSDVNEKGTSTPQIDPYDALNPEDPCIKVTRIEGVTTVVAVSGTRSPINGKAVAMNLEGRFAEEMVIQRYTCQIFNTGAKRREKYPSTYPGVMSFIHKKLYEAQRYMEKKQKKKEENEEFNQDLEKEALIPVLKGQVPALFITYDEVTIRNALKIIDEFKLDGIIHATQNILKFTDQLAEKDIPVLWGGTSNVPDKDEPYDLNYHTASILAEKGIKFAFTQGRPESRNARNLPVPASLSVAHGLSEEEAVKAVTLAPAEIMGIEEQVGSLEKGKTANVVIWSGKPIQMSSKAQTVIVNGKIIPQKSIQTELRDEYKNIVEKRQ
ncbi:amidohydrolase family protein [bacterium]|nr:amidohydrolase family protein [bacterium]